MCPRTAQAFEAIREESRDAIIQAALELFARHGFEKTSVRMIAEHAGISQGLMYNYFAGKQALLETIFERSMADVQSSFIEADLGMTPQEQLERLVRSSFEIIQNHRAFWTVFYSLRVQPGLAERLPAAFLQWPQQINQQLQGYLQALGVKEVEMTARILFAAIDGIAQHYVLEPASYPLEAVIEQLISKFVLRSSS